VVTDTSRVYYLVHKPPGVTSSSADPHADRLVVDLVPTEPRVHAVGRLDVDSEGLMVLTNDGDLTYRLTHPSHGIEKEYLVEVRGNPAPTAIRALREGVELDDGPTAPARVHVVDRRDGHAALAITIHEGRNRQVRRMCAAVGHEVTRLVRVRIGPVRDPSLAAGEWRVLTGPEVHSLYAASTRR
jgi:23S rRNA pseudouridine2605 synthase